MPYKITLIPGDGVGPEISEATRRVLEATGVKFDWEFAYAGAEVMTKEGTPLPDSVLASIKKNKVAIKGPVTTPVGTGFRSELTGRENIFMSGAILGMKRNEIERRFDEIVACCFSAADKALYERLLAESGKSASSD